MRAKRLIRAPGDLSEFVDQLQSSGRYSFTREEAISALGVSHIALQAAARRLAAKGRIAAPRRGFYIIVPVEYRSAGAPPPSWFVDDLMRFHSRPYYVGLLSAAALHGAAHQQPQEFQIVTDSILRPITVGRTRFRFFMKWHHAKTPTISVKTETGSMKVSTPEATALDLVRYVGKAGQLGNVVTVLSELAERINPDRLVDAARSEVELSVIQRLGYLLEHFAAPSTAAPLAEWLATQRLRPVPLRTERHPKATEKDPRWLVLVNERVEIDE
jgi:predicted transcriptional regulator of viral defense system